MIEVNVSINAPVLYCDETTLGIQLGNGYSFEKIYIDNMPFKEKITDGRGHLTVDYLGSVKSDENGKYLICISKEDVYQIENPIKGPGVYTDTDMMCGNQVKAHNQLETDYLHKMFSLLHLFKEGNIGTKEIFLDHVFSLGIMKNTLHNTSNNVTRNITDDRVFSLVPDEVLSCNQFLSDYQDSEYTIFKNCIDEFVWGLEQVDIATGFEQFTTALEMTLLGHNQQGKKEVLSKRVAVMLGNTPTAINQMYAKMKVFYRFRSESLHEGEGQNISKSELFELESIVRRTLVKCLERIKQELRTNASVTWPEVKAMIINDLKSRVATENTAGTFVS